VTDTSTHHARRRVLTWQDPLETAARGRSLSGLAFLQQMADGAIPPPPIAMLMGFRIVEVSPGRAVFACTPDESHYNPIGLVHGGLLCTLADTVIGCAVSSTLEAGVGYTSIDVQVSFLRPVTVRTGELLATGLVTKPGRRVAFARAEIAAPDGRMVATATGSCLIIDRPPDAT